MEKQKAIIRNLEYQLADSKTDYDKVMHTERERSMDFINQSIDEIKSLCKSGAKSP